MLLGEEVLLLLLNEKKSKLKKGTLDHSDLNYLLPATILEELRMLGRIEIDSEGKNASIMLKDDTLTNNPLLDERLTEIIEMHEQGKYFNFAKYVNAVGHKKQKWQERFWSELEKNGIIQNVKKKHILLKPEVKEKLIDDISDTVADVRDAGDRAKSLIAFYQYLPGAKVKSLISKNFTPNKSRINELIENQKIPKTVSKNVIVPARWKKAKKIIKITTAVQGQISSASSKFAAQVSGTATDFQSVIGTKMNVVDGKATMTRAKPKSWGELQSEKVLQKTYDSGSPIGGSPGDALLKGVRKLKKKKSENNKQE
jgi:hypothetical protein